MIEFIRTNSDNIDFQNLITELDIILAELDGEDHAFFAALNKTDQINEVIVAYTDGIAAGCGAIRRYDELSTEIKRMYTKPEFRGKGIASAILNELEKWAQELGFKKAILETGVKQTEAIHLYPKRGYKRIENYGQYKNVEASLCFEKEFFRSSYTL